MGASVPPTDSNADEPDGPNRRCVLSRAVRPRESMLRFVVGPDGILVPDLDASLPGRGLWLSPGHDMIEKAAAKGAFARAARQAVTVPEGLAETVDRLLEARCVGLIGLARKAGQAVAGYEKVKAWLRDDRAALVLQAFDGSSGERARLGADHLGVPVFAVMDRAVLGRAFAREQAVHAALEEGGLARRLNVDLSRLARLRGRIEAGENKTDPGRVAPAPGRSRTFGSKA